MSNELLSLRDLFIHDLRDVASAEEQIMETIETLEEATSTEALGEALRDYRQIVSRHREQLLQLFRRQDEEPSGKKCHAIHALTEADKRLVSREAEPPVMDAAVIGAVQRMQHYKIAAYGCVRTYAELLGDEFARGVLQKALEEESAADENFSELARYVNQRCRKE